METIIRITAELLPISIIMAMHHFGIRRINDFISRLYGSGSINHILIKNGAADKSPQPVINIPSVCGAYIGAEKSFYS